MTDRYRLNPDAEHITTGQIDAALTRDEPVSGVDFVAVRNYAALRHMMSEVVEFEHSKGWQPNDNRFGESLALLHSEVSEALEAWRDHGFRHATEKPDRRLHREGDPEPLGKPVDVASELADVLIRLLSTWAQFLTPHGFDLAHEFQRKMEYNRTRSMRHGGKAI